jgi:hypothetical protein
VPFTPAHPAAVLPFLRRGHWVSAGLVTGSLAPDLPTYLPLSLTHEQTHALSAILWPDGALALGLLVVWWGPLRPALMSLWPAAAARCGSPGWREPLLAARRGWTVWGAWVGWLLMSELLGLATHLGWDAFTHGGGYAVDRWPTLRHRVGGHPLYSQLQLWCSVLGIGIVAAYLLVQWRRRSRTAAARPSATVAGPALPRAVRVTVVAVLVLATAATGLLTHNAFHPYPFHQTVLWRHRVVAAITVLLVLTAAWSVALVPIRLARLRRWAGEEGPAAPSGAGAPEAPPHTKAPADVP